MNQRRGNHPFGKVVGGEAELTTTNGAKLGRCDCDSNDRCSRSKCFEPPDVYKGEFARALFYMAVRYKGEASCCQNVAVDRFEVNSWMESTLRQWHSDHPVTQRERDRNSAVEKWQGVRNPFVDHPQLVYQIPDF